MPLPLQLGALAATQDVELPMAAATFLLHARCAQRVPGARPAVLTLLDSDESHPAAVSLVFAFALRHERG
eukprot:SAG11_NODE_540_length_8654_cov_9.626110_11_plen_70_part_00